ncbi:MAG: prepilin-type N-terminal cleavage/methylation domain-containing protein [Desulfuromonadaceae bacterium]|nr:prepilin-type N-terminal cleavage/methylation domain-containing protein [Desulfuromonadaceae bacterium]
MRALMLRKNRKYLNQRGFTLIEVMVSIIILMVGLLGMFQAVNLALDKNLENQLREKGIAVAEQQLNNLKGRPFSNITGDTSGFVSVASGAVFKNISVQRIINDLATTDSKTKQVSIRVWWNYRGKPYEHQTASAIGSTELSTGN